MKKKSLSIILIIVLAMVLSLTACNKTVDITLTFIVDGEVYHTIDTNGNEAITMPSNPSKEGYTFEGWFWDRDVWDKPFTANSLLDVPLTESMSVYAKWSKKATTDGNLSLFTITFDVNGGTSKDPITIEEGSLINISEPTRSGYTFIGWYTDSDLSIEFTNTTMPSRNLTLYAKWTPERKETVDDIRFETDYYFEVNSIDTVKYNFVVDEFLVLELYVISEDVFNAVLSGENGEIKRYQKSRVIDSLLLENGEYSLVISKHEQDASITTNISRQNIIVDGTVALSETNPVGLLRFNIPEEYGYTLLFTPYSEDVLYDVYDEDGIRIYKNQSTDATIELDVGDYYFLLYTETEYSGKTTISKKTKAVNTSKKNAEQLSGSIAATGNIDVPGTSLYYSFNVDTDGSLILVRAFAEDKKHIVVYVTDSNDKTVLRAGLKGGINPSSDSRFDNEAQGEYVLRQGTYYLRVKLGTDLTGSFSISAGIPLITNTSLGATHSFNVSSNNSYYFRVYVPEKSKVYFNTYLADSSDRFFPFYAKTNEENGISYYTKAYNASMFTGDNHSYTADGHMITGYNTVNSKSLHDNPTLAEGYSDKSDFYYVCIRVFANASGGYVTLRLENNAT